MDLKNEYYIKLFQNSISSFDIYHQLAVYHILLCIILLYNLLSIKIVFYGDYYITKFDSEGKYPKIAKWIQLRRRFQHYSLWFHISLTMIIIIITLLFNIFYLYLF